MCLSQVCHAGPLSSIAVTVVVVVVTVTVTVCLLLTLALDLVIGGDVERLRRNDEVIEQALTEKERIVAEILQLPVSQYRHVAQVGGRPTLGWVSHAS